MGTPSLLRLLPLLLFIAGCATGARPLDAGRAIRHVTHPDGGELMELRGIVHVHSRYSHDSDGRIGQILKAAAKTGTDFIVVTDHNRFHVAGETGFYEMKERRLLLLSGIEYSTRVGHLLDLFPSLLHSKRLPPVDLVALILSSGGFPVVAHPTAGSRPWQDWGIEGLLGLEIYNVASDMREDAARIPGRVLRALVGRSDVVLASVDMPRKNIELWQQLEKRGRSMLIVAASNAHGIEIGGDFNWDDYRNSFGLVANRVWVRSFDTDGIREAFEAHRLYVAFDSMGDPAGFEFSFSRGDRRWIFGERVPYGGAGSIEVTLPYEGMMVLYRNDKEVERKEGTSLVHPVAAGGRFRIEVFRRDPEFGQVFPWIISHPIEIADAPPTPSNGQGRGGE